MKKIFYWSPHLSNVATIKNVINSAKSLKIFNKKDYEVSIIDTIGEWKDKKSNLNKFNVNVLSLSNFDLGNFLPITGVFKSRIFSLIILLTKLIPLKKILKKEKPDFFLMHLITIIPLILMFFSTNKTKFILRISGLPKLNFLRKVLWKATSKKIYLVTCPSNQTRNDLLKLKIFPKEKLKILYDPILEVNAISQNLKETFPRKFKDKKYFLNIGRLTKQKNQILLIKAFSRILKKYSNLDLIIIGEGEESIKLKRFVQLNNLQNKVFFLGQVKNVYPFIKNSIGVISTSLWEDPGAVMIESSFCKKPVISSNCPNGPEEFLSYGKGGYLFSNNDIKDLEKNIITFLKDEKKIIMSKILLSKKKSKNYSMFDHYQKLNNFLQQS